MGTSAAQESIVRLQTADLPQLETLLRANDLPADDCDAGTTRFYGIFAATKLIAAGGIEIAGDDCLLRSVVVAAEHRGRGLARIITDFLLEQVRARGCRSAYLLTETAAGYFEKMGFEPVRREAVPAPVKSTRQFAELCPDSAFCLALILTAR